MYFDFHCGSSVLKISKEGSCKVDTVSVSCTTTPTALISFSNITHTISVVYPDEFIAHLIPWTTEGQRAKLSTS